MLYQDYINKYENVLNSYWARIKDSILEWKLSYEWPQGVTIDEALSRRDDLETAINHDIYTFGHLSKRTFDKVMIWGFGRPSTNSENEIARATESAFNYLHKDHIELAALELTKLPRIGISRASKILALSDQDRFGIYDSRTGHGLSDLTYNQSRLIPIPPGYVIPGDTGIPPIEFCTAFQSYTWILRYLNELAKNDVTLRTDFTRVTDLEIAFFARSRGGFVLDRPKSMVAATLQRDDDEDVYYTLGVGRKATRFWVSIDDDSIRIATGEHGRSQLKLYWDEVEICLEYFSGRGWFLLGNAVDNVKPGGLGEYFRDKLGESPKFASHFASIMVKQGRLVHRFGINNRVELKVKL